MSDLCVTEHGDERPEALPGLRLCRHCRRTLERDLIALPGLWDRLGDHLAPGSTGSGSGRVSGTSSAPLPINPAVAELRDQIRHDLVTWAVLVSDERGLELPANTVPAIGAWLGRHVEWIAGHAAAAVECPPVMRELAARAHSVLNPSGAKRIAIGPCRETVDDAPCDGTLYATVRAEDDPRPSVIYCGACRVEYGTETWRRFGREYLRGRMAS